jgi:hypothetical protein|nr:MAG TPA: hypothetical protein [Caudoviricetes sp.]
MELSREFDNVDVLPIGEDVRHLDAPNETMIYSHSTWIESCNEKFADPTTSDYDIQRLTLEKSEYQSRINDMLAVKYAMLFAEQEHK